MSFLGCLQALLADNLAIVHWPLRFAYIAYAVGALYAMLKVVQITRSRLKTTALRGPPNPSFLWGVGKVVFTSADSGAQYEKWAEEYGGAYEVPMTLGRRKVVLCDPKAIAHFYAEETWKYILSPVTEVATEIIVGKGMLSAKGENHRRQRKALAPAFSNTALRNSTLVFYDIAYKVKGIWDLIIESNESDSTMVDIQNWMNHISLDAIGIAGFAHDFGSLDGKPASVTELFDGFGTKESSMFFLLLAEVLPCLLRFPTPYAKLVKRLNETMGDISNTLLTKSRKEKEAGTLGEREETSILGLLIRAEDENNQLHLTREEVMGQAKILLLAGYETTSISLTDSSLQWALIELARNSDMQRKLRSELLGFGADPTYDQLLNNLPYLDAVVHETLRLHPPLQDTLRMAAEDDVIPLSKPVQTRSGKFVDHISVAKGTYLSVSIPCMNRSTTFWSPDAKEFKPERWIGEAGIPATAREIQGHRHLLTFIDGPKTCLGKGFAIAEFKIVLSVLVKSFVFEFPGGPETVIEMAGGILPRMKVAGEEGTAVPLRIRQIE